MAERRDAMLGRKRAYHAAFDSPAGRAVLEDLAKFCGVSAQVHAPGDPLETAFRDGKRRVCLRIFSILGMSDREIFDLGRAPVPLQQEQADA